MLLWCTQYGGMSALTPYNACLAQYFDYIFRFISTTYVSRHLSTPSNCSLEGRMLLTGVSPHILPHITLESWQHESALLHTATSGGGFCSSNSHRGTARALVNEELQVGQDSEHLLSTFLILDVLPQGV